ncbi:hypothetical protein LTS18_009901, partial [Coniosporium uncinatum]
MESSASFAVGGKRPFEDDDPSDPHQQVGNGFQNNGIEDLSPAASRRKKGGPGSSNRTGQACDRCKTRKIRCDNMAGACSNCRQTSSQCITTDRNTGRPMPRGYHEDVETDNQILRDRLQKLEALLKQNNIPIQNPNVGSSSSGANSTANWPSSSWAHDPSLSATPPGNNQTDQSSGLPMHLLQALPALRNAQGGSYSGVQVASGSVLSHIKGTSLSFWGMEIDITNFAPAEANEVERYASYDTFIDSLGSTLPEPPLPPTLDDYNAIAMAYLNGLNPYTPVLDKRDTMALIERRYTDITFEPTAAERTILHMLLAHFYYQHSVRSDNDS